CCRRHAAAHHLRRHWCALPRDLIARSCVLATTATASAAIELTIRNLPKRADCGSDDALCCRQTVPLPYRALDWVRLWVQQLGACATKLVFIAVFGDGGTDLPIRFCIGEAIARPPVRCCCSRAILRPNSKQTNPWPS